MANTTTNPAGMCCPRCKRDGNATTFTAWPRIEVVIHPDHAETVGAENHYDDRTRAVCDTCGYQGVFPDFFPME